MNIIVTVCDYNKTFCYDLEVPVMQSIDTLTDDIVETLNGVNVYLKNQKPMFYVPRLQRVLNTSETLGQAGVWNGDYLVVVDHV